MSGIQAKADVLLTQAGSKTCSKEQGSRIGIQASAVSEDVGYTGQDMCFAHLGR